MTYNLECSFNGGWKAFIKGCSRQFGKGYIAAMRGEAPRLHIRLIDSTGKVVDELTGNDEVHIGQIAGWPTAEQYEAAAARALARAARIREIQSRKEPTP